MPADSKQHQIDFLFVLSRQDRLQIAADLCHDKDWSHKAVSNLEEAHYIITQFSFKIIFVEIDEDNIFGLQFLEWLQTQNVLSHKGLLFEKGYIPAVTKALSLNVENPVDFSLFDNALSLADVFAQALNRYDLEYKRRFITFEKSYLSSNQTTLVNFSDVCQKLWQDVEANCQTSDPIVFQGPVGIGKSHWLDAATAKWEPDQVVVFDLENTESYAQKNIFFEQLKKFGNDQKQIWIFEEISRLDFDLQEILAEILKNEGVVENEKRFWPRIKMMFSNTDPLLKHFEKSELREELFYLLRSHEKRIPELKKRPQDILGLTYYFLNEFSEKQKFKTFGQDVVDALQGYDWPGHISELKNVLKDLCDNHQGSLIRAQDLPPQLLEKTFYMGHEEEEELWKLPYQEAKKRALHKFHKIYMKQLLEISDQNYTVAAEKAGMDRSNFKKLLKKV